MLGPILSCGDEEDDGNGRHLVQAATATALVIILSRRSAALNTTSSESDQLDWTPAGLLSSRGGRSRKRRKEISFRCPQRRTRQRRHDDDVTVCDGQTGAHRRDTYL
jgi:hypothetical protein